MFSEQLAAAFTGFDDEIGALSRAERADADKDEAIAEKVRRRVEGAIVAAATAAVLGCVAFIWLGRWRYRRAAEPMHRQVEFTDALQLAESEEEAHGLLHRHLERSVSGSTVAVLNRNNSADRLEPVTPVAAGSPLATGLEHAEPRSCLAVRSGTTHEENHQGLLACGVCGPCPGRSICTPLTVGSEVIGAVLVNRSGLYRGEDRQCVRESVSQAAPVLANLRNLALAEQRAATDSLTGLPNKRMVGDTIKRMLAAASRASAPLCLLMLDLDHFRDINERFGHPAGDQALANVGATLRSTLRESDFAGRNGGEEFVVALPDTDLSGGIRAAETLRAAVSRINLPNLELRLTVSIGLAIYPDHAASAERLERSADAALYVAKRSGRNRVEVAASPPTGPTAPDDARALVTNGPT
jgi:diguanylate cyclase (GGDEF)-like protein